MRTRAVAGRWQGLGKALPVLWGVYSGSGKSPYLVCVDLAAGTAKCTCPSRQFPCKHARGLQELDLPDALPPPWVEEWTTRRRREPLDESPEAVERRAKARASRAEARSEAMAGGVAGLSDWLVDVAAAGTASLPGHSAAWWQNIAARMIDAQVPGLASAVTALQETVMRAEPHWTVEAADRLGALHLMTRVQPPWRLGVTVTEESVKSGEGWSDRWIPLMRAESDDGRVRTVRQWAWGRQRREWVVGVRHSAVGAPVPLLPHGQESSAELFPYPGAAPFRVALGELAGSRAPDPIPVAESWRLAIAALEPLIAGDPWTRLLPVSCASVRFAGGHLVDVDQRGVPVRDDSALDLALAITGGAAFDAWGLWDGRTFRLGAVATPGGPPEVVG
ncbi:hypothetical protein Lesp02_47680 [Lentzea sp. NBRC 105346]|uniref:SWIM zinc finger family protein n=1 Tax=Lentzea sp. NBRC 105346 TaxID=3032205 RepID=UPI0024A1C490|nr:SWIM zinc finger family protein [Lentzea sp. NBRC 105346]GLZ32580.1 hypothetical protein Lesp02_47680 [Lentzea sp. NBRC 105346]